MEYKTTFFFIGPQILMGPGDMAPFAPPLIQAQAPFLYIIYTLHLPTHIRKNNLRKLCKRYCNFIKAIDIITTSLQLQLHIHTHPPLK